MSTLDINAITTTFSSDDYIYRLALSLTSQEESEI